MACKSRAAGTVASPNSLVAQRFHRHRHAQKFLLAGFTKRNRVGELGSAFRQSARFVEGDGGQLSQIFEWSTAFDQHARPGRPRHACQHGTRRPERQGAGRSRHQHRHGSVKTPAERLGQHQEGEGKQNDQHQHRRNEPPFETVGEKLRWRLLALRFLHQLYQAGERAVFGFLQDLHFQHASAVDGSREGAMFRRDAAQIIKVIVGVDRRKFVHRNALARDGRLVDGAFAFHHHAIGGDFCVWLDDDDIADIQRSDAHFHCVAVAFHQRCRRGEV